MNEAMCNKPGCNNKVNVVGLSLGENNDVVELALCQQHSGELQVNHAFPDPAQSKVATAPLSYEECKLHKVLFVYEPQIYSIILKSTNSQSIFVMKTGYVEACSVRGAIFADKISHPTPFTYQFILNLVHTLGGQFVETVFDRYNANLQFYESRLVVRRGNGAIDVKCRGSDAVGISFLAKIPIKVNTAFLEG